VRKILLTAVGVSRYAGRVREVRMPDKSTTKIVDIEEVFLDDRLSENER
jgi:hypothetical protein